MGQRISLVENQSGWLNHRPDWLGLKLGGPRARLVGPAKEVEEVVVVVVVVVEVVVKTN